MQATDNQLCELQKIITKMTLEVCSVTAIPEFGVRWKEVSRAVKNARLPMQPSSIARVLSRHAAKSLPRDELDYILGCLRLKLVATQSRTWHVLHLHKPLTEEPVAEMLHDMPPRVLAALRKIKHKGMRPEVQSVMMGDLIYLSVQFVSQVKQSSVLYVATPPGQPVALVSAVAASKILKACVEGIGYASYTLADLHGKDIPSLLRVADSAWSANADNLTALPIYQPIPVLLPNGIDYTNKTYDEQYVERVIGPNPPILTDLQLKSSHSFYDRSLLNKTINLTLSLKSQDIAKTLQSWVVKGAITPTSDFFKIFHQIKSNKITYNIREDSDSD